MTLSTSVLQHKTQHGLMIGRLQNTRLDEKTFFNSQHPFQRSNKHIGRHRHTLYIPDKSKSIFHSFFSGMGKMWKTAQAPHSHIYIFKSHYGSESFPFSFGEVSGPESFSTGAGVLTKTQPSFSRFFCFILRF